MPVPIQQRNFGNMGDRAGAQLMVLDWTRDDNIQQWLDRTAWGRLKEQRYESEEMEQQELKKALGMA